MSPVQGAPPSETASGSLPRRPAPRSGTPKPVRHRRWRRIAMAAIAVALLGFGAVTFAFLRHRGGDEGVAATQTLMARVAHTLGEYRSQTGALPTELSRLFDPRYRYEGDVVPEDAWRGMIEYRVIDAAKGAYRLRSRGPDRRPDTADDLVWPLGTSWNDS